MLKIKNIDSASVTVSSFSTVANFNTNTKVNSDSNKNEEHNEETEKEKENIIETESSPPPSDDSSSVAQLSKKDSIPQDTTPLDLNSDISNQKLNTIEETLYYDSETCHQNLPANTSTISLVSSALPNETTFDKQQQQQPQQHQTPQQHESVERRHSAADTTNLMLSSFPSVAEEEPTSTAAENPLDASSFAGGLQSSPGPQHSASSAPAEHSPSGKLSTRDTVDTSAKANRTPSPARSVQRKTSTGSKTSSSTTKLASARNSFVNLPSSSNTTKCTDEDSVSKSSEASCDLQRSISQTSQPDTGSGATSYQSCESKPKNVSRLSERAKKKSWYNVLYPNYKSRAQDFKKLFKEVPSDERLIVDYSCALQRDILVQGRLYVSQNYVCFHANIFRWETYVCIKWKDVTQITKEKTALVIPNAIAIVTAKEKYFFATFTSRDKAFLMLFRVWQNTLMNKQMLPQEMWQHVHDCYGDELGLTTDDEDYIDPTSSVTAETEGELDFSSALEDTQSFKSAELAITESNNQANISQGEGSSQTAGTAAKANSGAGSGNSSGSGSGAVNPKSKTKSYFFSHGKSSRASQHQPNTSASNSDNKASDNNSSTDSKNLKKQQQSIGKNMKPYAKELTLTSAACEPEDSTGLAANNGAGGDGADGVVKSKPTKNTTDKSTTAEKSSSGTMAKEPKAISQSATHDGKRKVAKNTRQRDEILSKNAEAIPTDMSDSSDSDENKIPFVATAECTSTHEGRQLVHTILPINIETLFNLLFTRSKFLVDFHQMRKSTDLITGDWGINDEGEKSREVKVTVQLAASVGPKTSKVTEYQVIRCCSKPNELYSIDITSVNAGIPYADSFSVLMHYCLVRTVDDHTMLSVHAQIKYKKSIWGVVKGFIEKNTWAGLEDFYTALLHALQSETCIPPAKGKGRRPRRGTAAQIRPTEDSNSAPAIHSKLEQTEHNKIAAHASNHNAHHHVPHASTANDLAYAGETSSSKYKWLSFFVIMLLTFLIAVNVILLLKLWRLEERIEEDMISRARMPNLAALKQLPNSHQEWIELLRQQEILHETELKKWNRVLQTAIELLKKTEKTLAELMFR